MRVGVESDVGDGKSFVNQEGARREVLFEHTERVMALGVPRNELFLACRNRRREYAPETRPRDHAVDVRLLEPNPLEHPCTKKLVVWQERRPLGEVDQDRRALAKVATVVELEHRNLSERVHGQERRTARLAL